MRAKEMGWFRRFWADKNAPIPRIAWLFLLAWAFVCAYTLWNSRVKDPTHPEGYAVWVGSMATEVYAGLTLLLVFLTWRLYTLATEATTQTERAHRASHSPLLMAKISAVVGTGSGRSMRMEIANVGEGAAYGIRTRSFLQPGYGKPDPLTAHTVALPKGQAISVLLDVTWLIRLFRERLHDLIQAGLPAGIVYPRREDNYEELSTFEEDLHDLCSFLDCDFNVEVCYADLYGSESHTVISIPRGELALQRVTKVHRDETSVSPPISHEIDRVFDPGEELDEEYIIDLKHPGYWPSSVAEVRLLRGAATTKKTV
jgi:hypothetical protein